MGEDERERGGVWKGSSGRKGGGAGERRKWEMSETPRGDRASPCEGEGEVGWVGRCHFRYSMEPALCEHVGNTRTQTVQ